MSSYFTFGFLTFKKYVLSTSNIYYYKFSVDIYIYADT